MKQPAILQQFLILLCIKFCCVAEVISQNQPRLNPYGHWLVYTGDNKINQKIGIHSEVQLRSYFLKNTSAQSLVRVGFHWYANPLATLTAGYGYFYTTPSSDNTFSSAFREHRIWQQLILRHRTKAIFMEHRYRLEQRFIENKTKNTSVYDNRVRYRFQAIFPLYSVSPHLRHLFITANNEIFINIGRGTPAEVFDRNRFYTGIGYQVSPKLNFQAGYLHQSINQPQWTFTEINHLFQISVAYNMDDIMKTVFNKKNESGN